jgi:hypothetical protein
MASRLLSLVCLFFALGALAVPTTTESSSTIVPLTEKRMFGNSHIAPPPYVAGPRFNGTAVPAPDAHELSNRAAALTFPRWVAYSDAWVSGENGPPAASSLKGYNTL